MSEILRSILRRFAPLATAFCCAFFTPAPSVASPNVLLIMTDDLGYSDVGYTGNPIVRTPEIDRLARSAVTFSNFYVQPVCSPSRAALMTGRHPLRTGVVDTEGGVSVLPPAEVTIAEALKGHGYSTGLFGKWHLGDNAPARPQDQGFDQVLTHIGGMIGASYTPPASRSYFDPLLIDNGVERPFAGYAPDIFTDAAIDFIAEAARKRHPFFAFLSFNTPHHPLTVGDDYADPYRRQGLSEETSRFYGMISNIDANIARVVATLKAARVYDNTVILFMSDNGTSSLHTQSDLWQSGLRGRKTFVYENGIRSPLIIKPHKGSKSSGRREDLVIIEDIMPTVLELVGVAAPADFDGVSIAPIFSSKPWSPPERTLFFQFHRGATPEPFRNIAVIKGSYKLVQPVGRGIQAFSTQDARFELYDLAADPFERENVAATNPALVNELKDTYSRWFAAIRAGASAPTPIWIGDAKARRVHLTRQDWQGASTADGDLGFYDLVVRSTGAYRLTFRWSKLLTATHNVTIMLDKQRFQRQILASELEARIDHVELPAGPLRLQAWIEIDGGKAGFESIDIEHLDR
jgi:arylsulfatase A